MVGGESSIMVPAASAVLVVEDDVATRDLLEELLQSEGYTTLTAATVQDGLNGLAADQVDLVLLDLTLPDSNGVQFCAQVRRRADWQELPIIVLSGQNSDEWRDAALAAGADDYVSKPFDLSELLDRVQQLLD